MLREVLDSEVDVPGNRNEVVVYILNTPIKRREPEETV